MGKGRVWGRGGGEWGVGSGGGWREKWKLDEDEDEVDEVDEDEKLGESGLVCSLGWIDEWMNV